MYLKEHQINRMAESAAQNYEFSCSWDSAADEARQFSIDEWGIKPRKSAVLLAVKRAKVIWMGAGFAARFAIANG
jgi:hypothetical protein